MTEDDCPCTEYCGLRINGLCPPERLKNYIDCETFKRFDSYIGDFDAYVQKIEKNNGDGFDSG